MLRTLLSLLVIGQAMSLELTPDNWDKHTSGKQVFIKFLAPWCGHCKRMKPAWDKLMDAYSNVEGALVADVDCTSTGKPLCEKNGVRGYPTIMYGEVGSLKKYQGGRDFEQLKKFADANLKSGASKDGEL